VANMPLLTKSERQSQACVVCVRRWQGGLASVVFVPRGYLRSMSCCFPLQYYWDGTRRLTRGDTSRGVFAAIIARLLIDGREGVARRTTFYRWRLEYHGEYLEASKRARLPAHRWMRHVGRRW